MFKAAYQTLIDVQGILSNFNRSCFSFSYYVPRQMFYSKISLLRPLKIKTTSLFRTVFDSPKWYFLYNIVFYFKTTSLIRPLLGSCCVPILITTSNPLPPPPSMTESQQNVSMATVGGAVCPSITFRKSER